MNIPFRVGCDDRSESAALRRKRLSASIHLERFLGIFAANPTTPTMSPTPNPGSGTAVQAGEGSISWLLKECTQSNHCESDPGIGPRRAGGDEGRSVIP